MKAVLSIALGVATVAGREPKTVANTPLVKVSAAAPFGDMKGNQKREELATAIADQVRRDSRANYRISGVFESYEKADASALKSVKADHNMVALIQKGSRVEPAKIAEARKSKQVALDDVQRQIEAQRNLIVDIHAPFAEREQQDSHELAKIKHDPRLQALLQTAKKGEKQEYSWDTDSSTSDSTSSTAADSSSGSGSVLDDTTTGLKSFDWRKLSDEITESAHENGLGDAVDAVKRSSEADFAARDYNLGASSSSGSEADSTSASTDTYGSSSTGAWGASDFSATESMDDMNKYIAKFNAEKPADVEKRMNPNDFSQDFPHSSNYGGSVISIPLSSQLQVSASSSSSFLQTRIAPGVEEEVAKEKKWDVYLADGFKDKEVKDSEEIKRMKGRKEYGP